MALIRINLYQNAVSAKPTLDRYIYITIITIKRFTPRKLSVIRILKKCVWLILYLHAKCELMNNNEVPKTLKETAIAPCKTKYMIKFKHTAITLIGIKLRNNQHIANYYLTKANLNIRTNLCLDFMCDSCSDCVLLNA